ncbi:MAG: DUF4293 domain-containing protein [Spirosomataceae bacterium]
MLQRIQSVFLAIVSLAMGVYLVTPTWMKSSPTEQVRLNAFALIHTQGDKTLHDTNTIYLSILAIIAACVALFSVFQYHNRLRQMMLGMVNSLVMVVLLGLSVYNSFQGGSYFEPAQRGNYAIGFYAIAVGLIANVLANRFIRRDEQKVRDANRMR